MSLPVYLHKSDADLLGLHHAYSTLTMDQVKRAVDQKLKDLEHFMIPEPEKLELRRAYINVYNKYSTTVPFLDLFSIGGRLLGPNLIEPSHTYQAQATTVSHTGPDGALYTEKHMREEKDGRPERKTDAYYRNQQPITLDAYRQSSRRSR